MGLGKQAGDYIRRVIGYLKSHITVETLKFLLLVVGAGAALWKYFDEQTQSRKTAARQLAIQSVVIEGFLTAASELEATGHQAVFAWMSLNDIRVRKDPPSELRVLRDELLKSEHCRSMAYGDNTHFAEAAARISMIDKALYYVILNSYGEVCKFVKVVTLEPADAVLKSSQSSWKFANSFYRFSEMVATKGAEILVNDPELSFATAHIRCNPRLVALINICEEFRKRHQSFVKLCESTQDPKVVEKPINEFNQWMIDSIDGDHGLNSI